MRRILPKRSVNGITTALVTPFDERGDLNLKMVRPLVEFNLKHGIIGFFVCGSTGEGLLLSLEERRAMAAEVMQQVAGRAAVLVHVGTLATRDACALAEHAEKLGADAVSAIPPIYYKLSDRAIAEHYLAIARSTSLPTFIYHIPESTGHRLSIEFVLRCREQPNICGVKFSDNDMYLLRAIMDAAGPDFIALTGNDQMLLPGLSIGTNGAVGNNMNIMPQMFVRTYNAFRAGRWEEAQRVFGELIRYYTILRRYDTRRASKRVMRMLGLDCGMPRPPIESLTEEETARLEQELRSAGFFKMHGLE